MLGTIDEIKVAIKILKKGKCPGRVYKGFDKALLPILKRTFNWALGHSQWESTWCSSINTVIHKDARDPTVSGFYRPVTSLNEDQNILSSILADGLSKTILHLIDPDQTGFIPNKYLTDNVRQNLHEYSNIDSQFVCGESL